MIKNKPLWFRIPFNLQVQDLVDVLQIGAVKNNMKFVIKRIRNNIFVLLNLFQNQNSIYLKYIKQLGLRMTK